MSGGDDILGAARIYASHSQFALCETPGRVLSDDENWDEVSLTQGFAGARDWRLIATESDLYDHWVELTLASEPPDTDAWDRIICCDFETASGAVHVMGILDSGPSIAAQVPPGSYAVFVCVQNPGVDLDSTGELAEGVGQLTEKELAAREDLERYTVILVPGTPLVRGFLVDSLPDEAASVH